MSITRIQSGGVFEGKVGYCRAVVAGGWVHVAGTTAQGVDIPDNVVDQCASALDTIRDALAQAGAGPEHIVRVSYMLPDKDEFEPCWPLLVAFFGANPPAATMIETNLIDPRYRIEIEVTAFVG